MAKISLADILSGFVSASALNSNFTDIEAEFQNKVLYRDNPAGEPNQMENDLDMNSNQVLNATTDVSDPTSLLTVGTGDSRYLGITATADDADLLDGQDSTYYLDRANHTGTQTLSSISDSGTAATADAAKSIQVLTGLLQLVNDEASPGSNKYYGTDGTNTKGYHDLPSSSAPAWGDITGTLSNQTDLQSALSNKLDLTAKAADSDLLDGLNSTYILSRTNHTGTQTLSTISDAGTAAAAGTTNSIEINAGDLQFVNDQSTPGSDKYYGTDSLGTKGFHSLPSGSGGPNVDEVRYHSQTITSDYTIPANNNAGSYGPTMAIGSGSTVTIGSGSFWTILGQAA